MPPPRDGALLQASAAARIEAQFTALRYFALDGTTTPAKEQASMIRRYIIWRNNHAYDDDSVASSNSRKQPVTTQE